jgi:hypothetical protein
MEDGHPAQAKPTTFDCQKEERGRMSRPSPTLNMKATAAALLVVAGLSMPAQAQQSTLTLACKGTTTVTTMEDAKPEPISMGIIVNFTARTVQGFLSPGALMDYPVKITAMNDVIVAFSGSEDYQRSRRSSVASIDGFIDRVTGDVEATSTLTATNPPKTITSTTYALKCRPTQRMF